MVPLPLSLSTEIESEGREEKKQKILLYRSQHKVVLEKQGEKAGQCFVGSRALWGWLTQVCCKMVLLVIHYHLARFWLSLWISCWSAFQHKFCKGRLRIFFEVRLFIKLHSCPANAVILVLKVLHDDNFGTISCLRKRDQNCQWKMVNGWHKTLLQILRNRLNKDSRSCFSNKETYEDSLTVCGIKKLVFYNWVSCRL